MLINTSQVNPELDKFCEDYNTIFILHQRQSTRIKELKLKGYNDEQIVIGVTEYKNRKEQIKVEQRNNRQPAIINLMQISIWDNSKESVTFNDIIGLQEAKAILIDRFDKFYKYYNKMAQYKVEPSSGIGLHGVPGVGKSELMKALLNQITNSIIEPKPILLYISISDLMSGQRGEVSKAVKLMFDEIKKLDQLVIICIDEIDMIMRSKNSTNSVLSRELTSIFLQQWNGSGNIFVVFTTNNLQDLEEAFISRVGYENCAICEIPTIEERRLLIDKYMSFPLTEEAREIISKLTEGYVGRDIKKLASQILVLTEENPILTEELITNRLDEINKAKNRTIDAMIDNSPHKNRANKYKVIDIKGLTQEVKPMIINNIIVNSFADLDRALKEYN